MGGLIKSISMKMMELSRWGKNNPQKARGIIAISHTLLIINALFLGFFTSYKDIVFPKWVLIILPILFFGVYLSYPVKGIRAGLFKHSWFRQKTHDVVLIFFYVIVIAIGFNRFASSPVTGSYSSHVPTAQFIVHKNSSEVTNDKGTGIWQTLKQLKKEIKKEIKALKKDFKNKRKSKWSTAAEILLFVGSLLVALILIWLVGALACSLSCSGMEGLAIIVLILGWGGTILLTVLGIRKILKKTRIEKQKDNETSLPSVERPPIA